jgi:hypothetical protein
MTIGRGECDKWPRERSMNKDPEATFRILIE